MSVLPNELRTFEYYKRKLPLYLQNSQGFQEHFKIWFDLMMGNSNTTSNFVNGVVPSSETLLSLLNIFDGYYDRDQYVNSYLEHLNSLKTSESETSDILDKIGALYGLTRQLRVTYKNEYDEDVVVDLNLSDEDFLILIKCEIIKNYCEGTREQILEYYRSVGLKMTIFTSSEPATCLYYLITSEEQQLSNDILTLLLAGKLIIRQMGVKYTFSTISDTKILTWLDTDEDVKNINLWCGDDFEYGGVWL